MEELKKVMAVIVTYNRKELLGECIEALLNQDYKNCDILIVDNASTDGTMEYIKEILKNDRVKYVNTGANLGGAGGFNYGIKEACKIGCDFIWVMDDDCIVHKDSLTKLLEADNKLNGEYGFLSSKVLWKDDSICKMNIQKRKFSKWLTDYDTNMQTIEMASFVSLFIKVQVVEELGLPIKDFFIWTDDWEYTRRISRKYKCYYISESIVTHKSNLNEGASIATVEGERLERFKYMYRNDVFLYRREGIKGWILLYLRLLLHKLRILKSDKKNKRERIKLINQAIKKGKKFFPRIEKIDLNKKIKIIEFFGEPLNFGGQEAFVLNLYSKINKEEYDFTFITPFECTNKNLQKLIENNNDKLIVENKKFNSRLRKKYTIDVAKKYITEDSDVIHIHSGSTYTLYKVAKIAKKAKLAKVIVHSHVAGKKTIQHKIIKKISDLNIDKYVDYYFACSDLAGRWKFPKRIIESSDFFIIKNGVDIDKFSYDDKQRNIYKKQFEIENNKILIHIGRFDVEKNHEYIVNVFNEVLKLDKSFRLFLVGGVGNTLDKVKEQIDILKLNNRVTILINRDDTNKLINMSDVFILPSLWEGLPVTGVEAQANGIPCIFSDTISNEVNISKSYNKLSIKEKPEVWAKKIVELSKVNRIETRDDIKDNGYDILSVCKFIEKIYGN